MRKILTAYYNREPEKSKCLLCPMETKLRIGQDTLAAF